MWQREEAFCLKVSQSFPCLCCYWCCWCCRCCCCCFRHRCHCRPLSFETIIAIKPPQPIKQFLRLSPGNSDALSRLATLAPEKEFRVPMSVSVSVSPTSWRGFRQLALCYGQGITPRGLFYSTSRISFFIEKEKNEEGVPFNIIPKIRRKLSYSSANYALI